MSGDDNPESTTARKIWLYGSIVVLIVALYSGWTLFSRWQENRGIEQKAAEQKAAKERDDARQAVETLGGDRFDILSFYASPGVIRSGEASQLCYGVSNTKTVRLEPPVASMWPSLSRCFDIAPAKTATYTLTAEDGQRNTKTRALTITVK